jgi:hypothetical protein
MACNGEERGWLMEGGYEVGREIKVCHFTFSHIIVFEGDFVVVDSATI